MKKYLVTYKDDKGTVYEKFKSETELNEIKEKGRLVSFRKLSHAEIMEIATYSI